MSKNLNKVMLTGNLGKDVDLSITPTTGKTLAKFSVASSNSRKTPDVNGKMEDTNWFNVVAWDALAQTCADYLHKGSRVFIEGKLQTRKYEKDGEEKWITEVIASNMIMLDSKGSATGLTAESEEEETDLPF